MNCQDIARIADRGDFNALSAAERHAAEAHARSCPRCAPVWGSHARLTVWGIPPMPPEFVAQCRALVVLPDRTQGRPALRRLTLVGGLVVLAAAAALLAIYLRGTRAPESGRQTAVVTDPAATSVSREVAAPATPTDALGASALESPLLLLPPDYSVAGKVLDRALQRAADLHPELVAGPPIDGYFVVALLIRANGTLVDSYARLVQSTSQEDSADVLYVNAMRELEKMLPGEASRETHSQREKGTVLPDGRSLRAEVKLMVSVIPDDFDMKRSSINVLATVRRQHADLLLPATGDDRNSLAIFLAEDGSIQRMDLQHTTRKATSEVPPSQPDDPVAMASSARNLAQDIARRLSMDVEQIGQVGSATLEEGRLDLVREVPGFVRYEDSRRVLNVLYAWPRRAGESTPMIRQIRPVSSGPTALQAKFDEVAALRIIKREIPDAFTVTDPAAGIPCVVLTYRGELIRAGRVNTPGSDTPDHFALAQQLAPGVEMGFGLSRSIKDETGATITVVFVWEKVPDTIGTN